MLPLVVCAASWMADGVPALTDAGFIALTLICLVFTSREVLEFGARRSPGRIVLYAGVLVWFCQDYLANWLDHDFSQEFEVSPRLLARVATMHALFVLGMSVGVSARWGVRLGAALDRVPEPRGPTYLNLVLVLFAVGLIPYVFFSRDSLLDTIGRSLTGFYAGGARFTFGRTGNLNYDWGGYLYELVKLGKFGGLLAAFFAVIVARTPLQRALGWGIWAFWTLLAFGGGTRGELVSMTMPVIVLQFLRHHAAAARVLRRVRPRARLPLAVLALSGVIFLAIQVQGQLRSRGLTGETFEQVKFGRFEGNHMISEGLPGWDRIPAPQPPFYDTFPGEGAVRALPQTLLLVAVHPVPRALWPDKPVDPVWAWYNHLVVGTEGVAGTTVSPGLAGWWFFRFGAIGMVEGALLMGALFAAADRATWAALAARRAFALVLALGFLAWLFRCFRGLSVGELYGIVVAAVAVGLLVRLSGARR